MANIKNPLYVVSNSGQDVESVTSYLELVIKKFGLRPYLDVLDSLVAMLTNQVGNYGFFVALQEFIDHIVAQIEKVVDFTSNLI